MIRRRAAAAGIATKLGNRRKNGRAASADDRLSGHSSEPSLKDDFPFVISAGRSPAVRPIEPLGARSLACAKGSNPVAGDAEGVAGKWKECATDSAAFMTG